MLVEILAELMGAQIITKDMSLEQIKEAVHDTYMRMKGLQSAEACGGSPEQAEAK